MLLFPCYIKRAAECLKRLLSCETLSAAQVEGHADFPIIYAFLDRYEVPNTLRLETLENLGKASSLAEGYNHATAALLRDDLKNPNPHSSVSSYSTARIRSIDTTYPIIYSMAISSDNLETAHDIHTRSGCEILELHFQMRFQKTLGVIPQNLAECGLDVVILNRKMP